MEVASLKHRAALRGPTPFLRLQGDERLVALTRRGNQSAYEVLVARYQARLLGFCRHMLASKEDAEDVLQEVFAAAFNAMLADDRPINVRPWLYRIARNRSLNHLRKQTAIGVDSMDVHLAEHGTSTADKVHDREEFRQLVGDVQGLPETQRTALLLREIDALSYDQIAQAMETTVPAIKSLLVRARVGLAEAAEARGLSCEEVRAELGEVSEGLRRKSPPVRRHVRDCDRCAGFEKQLTHTTRQLAAVFPVGPLLLLKKFLVAQGASSAAGAAGAAGGSAAAGAGVSAGAGSAVTAGLATLATKTAAVVAGAAIVTAGAVEVDHSRHGRIRRPVVAAGPAALAAPVLPRVLATTPQPLAHSPAKLVPVAEKQRTANADREAAPARTDAAATAATGASGATGATGAAEDADGVVDTGSDVTALPSSAGEPGVPVPSALPTPGPRPGTLTAPVAPVTLAPAPAAVAAAAAPPATPPAPAAPPSPAPPPPAAPAPAAAEAAPASAEPAPPAAGPPATGTTGP